jgi:SAM-dependent methyltransferase
VSQPDILRGYGEHAGELIPRFETLSSVDVLAPVLEVLPNTPAHVLEVGAGTGRDASWLARQGHKVVAVEPVAELRHAGMALHRADPIHWVDNRLPSLESLLGSPQRYDLILAIAVLQHIAPEEHPAAIRTLAALAMPQGRIVLSLRHGPAPPSRPCFPADPERVVECAESAGLRLHLCRRTPSIQQENRDAGVTWTWLCFERR